MRKTRGFLFMLIGLLLAGLAGYSVLQLSRHAEAEAALRAVTQTKPVQKVYVVVAQKDLPQNVAISSGDIARKEFPADFAPPDAIAAPDIAVGKYTTARIYKGEILVSPLLAESKESSALASEVPDGKVAMAVTVNDALNSVGVLRPGDHVDIMLTLNLKPLEDLASQQLGKKAGQQTSQQSQDEQSTQLTLQNVQILAIGPLAGDTTTTGASKTSQAQQVSQEQARTITFLLDHQDALTLKYIKDSGGTMDLVLRSPTDTRLAETNAVTMDTLYRQFHFRFVQPVH